MGKTHLSVGEKLEATLPTAQASPVWQDWWLWSLQMATTRFFSCSLTAFPFLLPFLSVAEKCRDVNSFLAL